MLFVCCVFVGMLILRGVVERSFYQKCEAAYLSIFAIKESFCYLVDENNDMNEYIDYLYWIKIMIFNLCILLF